MGDGQTAHNKTAVPSSSRMAMVGLSSTGCHHSLHSFQSKTLTVITHVVHPNAITTLGLVEWLGVMEGAWLAH